MKLTITSIFLSLALFLSSASGQDIVLCGGVQDAIQCSPTPGGGGACSNTYSHRIRDNSQDGKNYVSDDMPDDLNADPCAPKLFGSTEEGVTLNCVKPWGDVVDGEEFAQALRGIPGRDPAVDFLVCRRVMSGDDCYYMTNGLLTLRHKKEFECYFK